MDDGACLYCKLTNEHKGSGELKKNAIKICLLLFLLLNQSDVGQLFQVTVIGEQTHISLASMCVGRIFSEQTELVCLLNKEYVN